MTTCGGASAERERHLRNMHAHFVRGVYRLFVRTIEEEPWEARMHFGMAVTHLTLAREEDRPS